MRHLVDIGLGFGESVASRFSWEREEGRSLLRAAAIAVWRPIQDRARNPRFLERVFRPAKWERRIDLDNMHQCAFWCGGAQLSEESWVYVEELLKEFGGDFPPRDYEPQPIAELIGERMGMTPEQIAAAIA